jgi:carboxyl-terminal processing protease
VKKILFFCLLTISSNANALSFFGIQNDELKELNLAYEKALPEAELKNAKNSEKVFKEAYELLLKHYIYEYSQEDKQKLVQKAITSIPLVVGKLKENNLPLDAVNLMNGIMSVVLNEIDAHTLYLSKKDAENFTQRMTGNYKGIGVMFNFDPQKAMLLVIKVFDNSPAKKAGIIKNDYIYAVDGEPIDVKSKLEDTINKIKGQDGTTVKITLKRNDELVDVLVTRGDYYVPSVEYKIYDNKYAYIQINSFNHDTASLFRNALLATGLNNLEGLIIDVRNNGGGLLPAVVLVADNILSGEKIVSIEGRNESYNKTFLSINKILVPDEIPIIVLTNSLSASASELLAGALAINNRAILMGDATFGKWSVQSSFNLGDGSIFNITTQLFYGPKSATFQGIGISPDIEIMPKNKAMFREKDYPNYLKTNDVDNVIRKSKLSIDEDRCPVYENKDFVLGCAILYFQSNGDLNKFSKNLK